MSRLRVNNIEVRYGDLIGVSHVSLEVPTGAVVALIGANGSGKSTTLRAIIGLSTPSAGTIEWDDRRIDGMSANAIIRCGLTLAPEGWRLFAQQSVEQNLRLGATILRSRTRTTELLTRVYDLFPRLRERYAQIAGTLSGGERQMLAIGRALMSDPQLLMLDEPSLGLAPVIVERLYDTIAQLARDGLTLLLAEQSIEQALDVATYGYVLQAGATIIEGKPEDLRADPAVQHAYLGV
ncbi:MAG TPA: ABC transporter ATP-binding protein [Candidatus Baltobacteraceae bacterium]|jgi:branched-chain amino acid transport system ATP-binding protein